MVPGESVANPIFVTLKRGDNDYFTRNVSLAGTGIPLKETRSTP